MSALPKNSPFQNTALHVSALHNSARCARFLLNQGVVMNRNKSGETAFDTAIVNKSEEAAMMMVCHDRWTEILMQPSKIYGWSTYGLIQELPSVMKVPKRGAWTIIQSPFCRDQHVWLVRQVVSYKHFFTGRAWPMRHSLSKSSSVPGIFCKCSIAILCMTYCPIFDN